MRLELTGRQVSISPGLRALVDDKLARVLRQVNDSAVSASVIVSKEKFSKVAEVSLHARGERFLHAVSRAETWELAINQAVEKLEQQARKMKGKVRAQQKRAASTKGFDAPYEVLPELPPPTPVTRVIRARRYAVNPMTVDEASLAMEQQDAPFLVYRDATTDSVHVIYRRKDGHLGLIEPDA